MSFSNSVYLIEEVKFHNLLNDYKLYGEDSYVNKDPELLKLIFENIDISMNDIDINGEALEYHLRNNPNEIGKLFASIKNIDNPGIIGACTTYESIVENGHVISILLEDNVARHAIFNSETFIGRLLERNDQLTELIFGRYCDILLNNDISRHVLLDLNDVFMKFITTGTCKDDFFSNNKFLHELFLNNGALYNILDAPVLADELLKNEYVKKILLTDVIIMHGMYGLSNFNIILDNDELFKEMVSSDLALYHLLSNGRALEKLMNLSSYKLKMLFENPNTVYMMLNIPDCNFYVISSVTRMRILINNNVIKPFLLNLQTLEWIMDNEELSNEIFNNDITSTMIVENLDILRNFINNGVWLSYLLSNGTMLYKLCKSQTASLAISREVQKFKDSIVRALRKATTKFKVKEVVCSSQYLGQSPVKVANNPNSIIIPKGAESNNNPGIIKLFYGADKDYIIYEEDPVIVGTNHSINGISFNDAYYQGIGSYSYKVFFDVYETL